jgi:type II secretory ATPase GspE/PulE/Tfp pilus assembly ATPase PilB-like protein
LNVENCRIAGACDDCHQTGYAGRCLIADYRTMNELQGDAAKKGDEPLWASAMRLVEAGTTSPAEVVRVLGPRRD